MNLQLLFNLVHDVSIFLHLEAWVRLNEESLGVLEVAALGSSPNPGVNFSLVDFAHTWVRLAVVATEALGLGEGRGAELALEALGRLFLVVAVAAHGPLLLGFSLEEFIIVDVHLANSFSRLLLAGDAFLS